MHLPSILVDQLCKHRSEYKVETRRQLEYLRNGWHEVATWLKRMQWLRHGKDAFKRVIRSVSGSIQWRFAEMLGFASVFKNSLTDLVKPEAD